MQIRNVRLVSEEDHEFWAAEVVDGERRLAVDLKFGSWQATTEGGERRDVLPWLAGRLQEKVRARERQLAAAA